jgi:hypothetical protein
MTGVRQLELALERQRLQMRSAQLRDQLSDQSDVLLTRPLWLADQTLSAVRWLGAHPLVLLTAGVVTVLLRPRKTLRWGLRAWTVWRSIRRWQQTIRLLWPK